MYVGGYDEEGDDLRIKRRVREKAARAGSQEERKVRCPESIPPGSRCEGWEQSGQICFNCALEMNAVPAEPQS
jgi:hypothetical protein